MCVFEALGAPKWPLKHWLGAGGASIFVVAYKANTLLKAFVVCRRHANGAFGTGVLFGTN